MQNLRATVKLPMAKINLKYQKLLQTRALINGNFVTGSDPQSFAVDNPASQEVIAQVSSYSESDYQNAIDAASKAFTSFKTTTGRYRSGLMYKLYELMTEHKQDLAKLITLENGKPLKDALGEVTYAASFLQWFAEEAPRVNGDVIPSVTGTSRILTVKSPLGVCGILTPWNFPAAMITRKLGALIAAGNTAVIKPASETPLTALAIGQLIVEAGFPKGVVNIIPVNHEDTAKVGKFLTSHPTIKKISFTGSTRVGKLLAEQASGSTLKKLSLELGGNAPLIVFDDADLKNAVDGIVASKFRLSGQTCVCANRIFIQSGVYDSVVKELVKRAEEFKLGDGLDENVNFGPLIHQRSFNRVKDLVADAKLKGAKVLFGGSPATKYGKNFFEPTVLGNIDSSMDVYKDEIFGPVAGLVKFETEEEVLKLANDVDVGLAGYFFSKDYARVFRVAEALEVGMIGANTGAISEASLPFGGVKQSGYGREGSVYGVDDWLNVKSIVIGNI